MAAIKKDSKRSNRFQFQWQAMARMFPPFTVTIARRVLSLPHSLSKHSFIIYSKRKIRMNTKLNRITVPFILNWKKLVTYCFRHNNQCKGVLFFIVETRRKIIYPFPKKRGHNIRSRFSTKFPFAAEKMGYNNANFFYEHMLLDTNAR